MKCSTQLQVCVFFFCFPSGYWVFQTHTYHHIRDCTYNSNLEIWNPPSAAAVFIPLQRQEMQSSLRVKTDVIKNKCVARPLWILRRLINCLVLCLFFASLLFPPVVFFFFFSRCNVQPGGSLMQRHNPLVPALCGEPGLLSGLGGEASWQTLSHLNNKTSCSFGDAWNYMVGGYKCSGGAGTGGGVGTQLGIYSGLYLVFFLWRNELIESVHVFPLCRQVQKASSATQL